MSHWFHEEKIPCNRNGQHIASRNQGLVTMDRKTVLSWQCRCDICGSHIESKEYKELTGKFPDKGAGLNEWYASRLGLEMIMNERPADEWWRFW